MSDTRQGAEHELRGAGMSGEAEDLLGSALSSSFNMPRPTPRPKSPTLAVADEGSPASQEEVATAQEPIEGMDTWKETYESYLSSWHEESAVAREKALATRKRIEDELAVEQKTRTDRSRAEEEERKAKELQDRRAEKLRQELGGPSSSSTTFRDNGEGRSERQGTMREAWEMIRGAGESKEKAVETDARGVMEEDIAAAQAVPAQQHRSHIKQTAYNPLTSTEPLPPSMRSATPPQPEPMPSESITLSRHSATSEAWQHVSTSTSTTPEDLSPPQSSPDEPALPVPPSQRQPGQSAADPIPILRRTSASGSTRSDSPVTRFSTSQSPQPMPSHNTPPALPPSLTLSLFTMPSHITVTRVLAVLGINLVLPFINGIMLGFGEIFAREVVKVGKIWWVQGGGLFSGRHSSNRSDDRGYGGGRGVGNVGLSGDRGF